MKSKIDFVLAYVPDFDYSYDEALELAKQMDIDAAKQLEMDCTNNG